MKLLHTADWHLGKRLDRFSRLAEQAAVLEEICDIAEREAVDAVLIAGDLYDTFNPSTEAEELFYRTVARLADGGRRAVVAIAGNHDSPNRIEAPHPLAAAYGILLAGYPHSQPAVMDHRHGLRVTRSAPGFIELQLPGHDAPLRLLLTPYANELRLRQSLGFEDPQQAYRDIIAAQWKQTAQQYCDEQGVNILLAHLFMIAAPGLPAEEPDEEKPILYVGGAQAIPSAAVPPAVQYAALGHLHRQQLISATPCPVVYSSSPLAYSMSEAEQDKYVMIIEAQPGKAVEYAAIPLESGRRIYRRRFEAVAEAVTWLADHPNSYVELTIAADRFLSAADIHALTDAHDGIVNIIPDIREMREMDEVAATLREQHSIDDLFARYYQSRHGHEIPEEMMTLFRELIGVTGDTE